MQTRWRKKILNSRTQIFQIPNFQLPKFSVLEISCTHKRPRIPLIKRSWNNSHNFSERVVKPCWQNTCSLQEGYVYGNRNESIKRGFVLWARSSMRLFILQRVVDSLRAFCYTSLPRFLVSLAFSPRTHAYV